MAQGNGEREGRRAAACSSAPSGRELLHRVVGRRFRDRWSCLRDVYETRGQGAARDASGKLYEAVCDDIVTFGTNFLPVVGDLDLITTHYQHPDGQPVTQSNLQVDWHLWDAERTLRRGFVENKTYLDKPYLERAVSDMLEIRRALRADGVDVSQMKWAVLAGQSAVSTDSRRVQEARFYYESGQRDADRARLEIFFLHTSKRSSSRPVYRHLWPLDTREIDRFANYINA